MNLATLGYGGGDSYNNLSICGFGGAEAAVLLGEPLFIITITHKELYAVTLS